MGVVILSIPLAFISARIFVMRSFFRRARLLSKFPIYLVVAVVIATMFRGGNVLPAIGILTIGVFLVDLVNKTSRKTSVLDIAIASTFALVAWVAMALILVVPDLAISLLLHAPFAR